jgi:hypothetical protein
MYFFRPAEDDDVHCPPYCVINKRLIMHTLRLSEEAMRNVVGMWMSMQDQQIELPFIDPKLNEK